MEYRRLGRTGLPISVLSYGAWVTFGKQIDVSMGTKCLSTAYDNGINFFDNSEAYANGAAEIIIGEILKKLAWDRDTYMVSSKVFFGRIDNPAPTQFGLHRKHLMDACHAALKRLQLEYLDMFFCNRDDKSVPLMSIVSTMTNLVRQGKILYWGTSEWSARRIQEAYDLAIEHGLEPPLFEQVQYNLFHRRRVEHEYAPLYETTGLGTTIWSPLDSGLLTGKYNDGIPDNARLRLPGYEWLKKIVLDKYAESRIAVVKKLAVLAHDLGATVTQLALAWCLKNQQVSTVILGASNDQQLLENISALDVVNQLDDDVLARIHEILSEAPFTRNY